MKKSIWFIILVIIITSGLYLFFNNKIFRNNEKIDHVENYQQNTGLIESAFENAGSKTCIYPDILSQFSGYKIINNENSDTNNTGSYNINVYNRLDLSDIVEKEKILKEISIKRKVEIEKIEKKINEIIYEVNNSANEANGYAIDEENKYGISSISEEQISALEERFKIVDKISVDGSQCVLASENSDPGDYSYYPVDQKMIDSLNVFLGDLLGGNLNFDYLPSFYRSYTLNEWFQSNLIIHKKYKNGILLIASQIQGSDSNNIYYIQNIGNKLYIISSVSFNFEFREGDDKYIKNLLDGKENLPEYKKVYNKFIETVDYIFE